MIDIREYFAQIRSYLQLKQAWTSFKLILFGYSLVLIGGVLAYAEIPLVGFILMIYGVYRIPLVHKWVNKNI